MNKPNDISQQEIRYHSHHKKVKKMNRYKMKPQRTQKRIAENSVSSVVH